jgi:tetratricopeptide (TPR) repeat protein
MIVRDAADLLAATLDAVRSLADEIVVLDTGSRDATLTVARQGGARVFEAKWKDDFAAARNACLTHLKGDWVLWLDAGETLDDTAAIQLRSFLEREADPQKAYLIFVQLASSAPQLSGEQVGQLRLLPVRDDLRFVGRIRERILPSVLAAGLDVDALSCHIVRPAEDHAVERKRAKALRNLRIAAMCEQDDGESPLLNMVRAEAYHVLGQVEEAERHFRRTIELAERGSSEMLEAYYGLLTSFDSRPAQSETQIATCLEALDIFPLDAQLLCGMGSYLIKQGRLDLAARSYEIAATHGQVDPATWHLADIGEVAVACLALAHQLQDQQDQSRGVLEQALQQRPDSLRLRRQLMELHIKNKDRTAALAEFDRLPRDLPGREALRSAVRGALLAVEKNWPAAEPYLKTAYTAGCRDGLCLRWLTVSYLALGNLRAADEVLQVWRASEHMSGEIAAYEQALAERQGAAAKAGHPAAGPETVRGVQQTPATASGGRRVRIDHSSELSFSQSLAPLSAGVANVHVPEPPAVV